MIDAVTLSLVRIPGGTFTMGNDSGRPDERPAHRVTVGGFQAATTPVTNRDYAVFVEAAAYLPPPFWDDRRFSDPDQPVAGVSWFDAVAYCRWLSSQTGLRCRLPTEAEREYAALGGNEPADWPWGNAAPHEVAALSGIVGLEQPHVPSPECANGYGLRCMVDNLHEWCSDWYSAEYYAAAPSRSPRGPRSGERRASRGGSWRHFVKFNRISARSSLNPAFHYNDYGFRIFADL